MSTYLDSQLVPKLTSSLNIVRYMFDALNNKLYRGVVLLAIASRILARVLAKNLT